MNRVTVFLVSFLGLLSIGLADAGDFSSEQLPAQARDSNLDRIVGNYIGDQITVTGRSPSGVPCSVTVAKQGDNYIFTMNSAQRCFNDKGILSCSNYQQTTFAKEVTPAEISSHKVIFYLVDNPIATYFSNHADRKDESLTIFWTQGYRALNAISLESRYGQFCDSLKKVQQK